MGGFLHMGVHPPAPSWAVSWRLLLVWKWGHILKIKFSQAMDLFLFMIECFIFARWFSYLYTISRNLYDFAITPDYDWIASTTVVLDRLCNCLFKCFLSSDLQRDIK